jgi:hypothetical protein
MYRVLRKLYRVSDYTNILMDNINDFESYVNDHLDGYKLVGGITIVEVGGYIIMAQSISGSEWDDLVDDY